jgi:hypothetical protein
MTPRGGSPPHTQRLAASGILVTMALVACVMPALLALRTDVAVTLRHQ